MRLTDRTAEVVLVAFLGLVHFWIALAVFVLGRAWRNDRPRPQVMARPVANHAAKRWQRQTGGVVDLRDPVRCDKLLKVIPVEDVWGIGRRMQVHLNALGIKTAWDLASSDAWELRKRFNV